MAALSSRGRDSLQQGNGFKRRTRRESFSPSSLDGFSPRLSGELLFATATFLDLRDLCPFVLFLSYLLVVLGNFYKARVSSPASHFYPPSHSLVCHRGGPRGPCHSACIFLGRKPVSGPCKFSLPPPLIRPLCTSFFSFFNQKLDLALPFLPFSRFPHRAGPLYFPPIPLISFFVLASCPTYALCHVFNDYVFRSFSPHPVVWKSRPSRSNALHLSSHLHRRFSLFPTGFSLLIRLRVLDW